MASGCMVAILLLMTLCISCARGLVDECEDNCAAKSNIDETNSRFITITTGAPPVAEPKKLGRPVKEDADDIKDPHSTGRKRAAAMYPLDRDKSCEWRAKINCGGGKSPIAGCGNGLQENLHHGPDKSTLNNERVNVHKICSNCHNTWHAANDPSYDETDKEYLHSPVSYEVALTLVNKYAIQIAKRSTK